jgi:hypothetical protein
MKPRSFLLLYLCLITSVSCTQITPNKEALETVELLHNLKQTWTDIKDKFPEIQSQLSSAIILHSVPLKVYDPSIRAPNDHEVVLLKIQETTATDHPSLLYKAIFKPRGLLHQKVEEGAFKIVQYLNMQGLIPPTVRYSTPEKKGVLSYYIDTENNQNLWKSTPTISQIKDLLDPKSLNDFYTFAYVFGLWDLKWVNTLFVGQSVPYSIMCVDNESLMSKVYAPEGEHCYVCWRLDPACNAASHEDLSIIKDPQHFKSLAFILKKEEIPHLFPEIKRFFIHEPSIQKLATDEEKKQVIIKRMESFLWGKNSVSCYIGQKGLWLQLYADFPNIPPAQPNINPGLLDSLTVKGLKELSLNNLREFFQDVDEISPLLPTAHYNSIISRSNSLFEITPK